MQSPELPRHNALAAMKRTLTPDPSRAPPVDPHKAKITVPTYSVGRVLLKAHLLHHAFYHYLRPQRDGFLLVLSVAGPYGSRQSAPRLGRLIPLFTLGIFLTHSQATRGVHKKRGGDYIKWWGPPQLLSPYSTQIVDVPSSRAAEGGQREGMFECKKGAQQAHASAIRRACWRRIPEGGFLLPPER
eukprot:699413-Prorocentrum_minimum.AAC.2